jgi:hypothetical protein
MGLTYLAHHAMQGNDLERYLPRQYPLLLTRSLGLRCGRPVARMKIRVW